MSDRPAEHPQDSTSDPSSGDRDPDRLQELVHRLGQVHQRAAPRGPVPPGIELARRRLADLVEGLETCRLSNLPPPSTDEIELQLAAVEKLFESSGDPKSARVLAAVLESLVAPEAPAAEIEPPPPRRFQPPAVHHVEPPPRRRRTRGRVDEDEVRRYLERRAEAGAPRWLGLTVLGVLVVVAFLFMRGMGEDREDPRPDSSTVTAPAPARDPRRAVPPATVPTRSWTSLEAEAEDYELRLEQVKLEVAEGWRSVRRGDLETAVTRLATAVSLDRHHRMVRELADGVIVALVADAADAADHGRWEEAPERLGQARLLAENLSLDLAVVEAAEETLASMRRFDYVRPSDRAAITAAIGRQVRVTLVGAPALDGRLRAVSTGVLSLEVDSGVPGGEVAFTTEIPLERVRELRVYRDRD